MDTIEKEELFKQMFSEYCRNEVSNGYCDDAMCEFCCVGQAWERIFGGYDI